MTTPDLQWSATEPRLWERCECCPQLNLTAQIQAAAGFDHAMPAKRSYFAAEETTTAEVIWLVLTEAAAMPTSLSTTKVRLTISPVHRRKPSAAAVRSLPCRVTVPR